MSTEQFDETVIDLYLQDPRRQPLEISPESGLGPLFFRWVTRFMEHFIALILVALIASVSINVVGRFVFNHSMPWADEVARMLFVWLVFIGAAAAFSRYEHIAVDYLVRRMPSRLSYLLYLFQHLIIFCLMAFIMYGGYLVLSRTSGRSAILGVPWSYISVSFVICAFFIALVSLWRIWRCVHLFINLSSIKRGV